MLRAAVERQFEIIGEAFVGLRRVDPALAAGIRDLSRIIAFRNVLIHAYATVDAKLAQSGGYAYSEALQGLWTEGTAQVALLAALSGDSKRGTALSGVLDTMRTPSGGYYASNIPGLPTGFMLDTDPAKPRLYFRLPHLGAASWAALAERGFNPFTATKALP